MSEKNVNSLIHHKARVKQERRKKVTDEQIAEALKETCGSQDAATKYIARKYGITIDRSTISHRLANRPKLRSVYTEEKKITTDISIYNIARRVRDGDYRASVWWAEHSIEARKMGFGNRLEAELSTPGGKSIKVEEEDAELRKLSLKEIMELSKAFYDSTNNT